MRVRTLSYIESMRLKNSPYGQYLYSKSASKPGLYASCYAALTRHLYNDLDNLSQYQKRDWIDYIQSFQCEDGLFRDNSIQNKIVETEVWWGYQHLLPHVLMALNALGTKAKKRLLLIEKYKDERYLKEYLENLDFNQGVANTSNELQNLGVALQYARDFHGDFCCQKPLDTLFEFLDKKQCPDNGLYGSQFDNGYWLSQGVQAGYHFWLLYFYDNRRINFKEKIIDSVLKTQNILGGYGYQLNSSACEDIDSIDPLFRFSLSNNKKYEIENSFQRALPALIHNFNSDGGWVFRRHEAFKYGHPEMYSKENESSMFATWFRTLGLAYCIEGLKLYGTVAEKYKYAWTFLKCPFLQFKISNRKCGENVLS